MNAAWIAGALLGAAGLGLAAELIARAWIRRHGRPRVWTPNLRLEVEIDTAVVPMLEPRARVEINALGERGGAPPASWEGTYRVLVAGGSAGECYLVDQPKTWPEVLGRELGRAESLQKLGVRRVHVGNIARSLVASEEVDLVVREVLPDYPRLQLAVLMVGASDLLKWMEVGAPAEIGDGDIPRERLFAADPRAPFGWTPRTLALRKLASYWRRRLLRRLEFHRNGTRRLAAAREMRAQARELLHSTADPAQMLAKYERHLRRTIERLQESGARVVVARQGWIGAGHRPEDARYLWNFGRGRPFAEEVTAYYAHELSWRLLAQVDATSARVAAELGVEQVEVNAVVPRDFVHYYDDAHLTAAGCDKLGRAVAELVLRRASAATAAAAQPAVPEVPGVPGAVPRRESPMPR